MTDEFLNYFLKWKPRKNLYLDPPRVDAFGNTIKQTKRRKLKK